MDNIRQEYVSGELRVCVFPVDIFEFPELSISEQMVYIVLRSYCNAYDDTAFPSYETIAKKARITRRHVINCIQSLIEKGLVLKEARFKASKDKKVSHTSNVYLVRNPRLRIRDENKKGSEMSSLG